MKKTALKRGRSVMKRTQLKAKKGFKIQSGGLKFKNCTFKNDFKRGIQVGPPSKQIILDGIVSKVVRIGSSDDEGMVRCATCKAICHWKEMDCGHFQKRGNLSTRYDMRNLAPQCWDCNRFYDGREEEFAVFIDAFYGPGTANLLIEKAQEVCHEYPYDQEIIKWKAVLKKLLLDRGNNIEY